MVTRKPKPKLYRWHISHIRKKGESLGLVEAPDEATAIKEAIQQWEIKDRWKQDRVVARREGKRYSRSDHVERGCYRDPVPNLRICSRSLPGMELLRRLALAQE
jgi:hypothetical protein